jgi:hypothetical protein
VNILVSPIAGCLFRRPLQVCFSLAQMQSLVLFPESCLDLIQGPRYWLASWLILHLAIAFEVAVQWSEGLQLAELTPVAAIHRRPRRIPFASNRFAVHQCHVRARIRRYIDCFVFVLLNRDFFEQGRVITSTALLYRLGIRRTS